MLRNKAVRLMLGGMRTTPLKFGYVVASIPHFKHFAQSRRAALFSRIIRTPATNIVSTRIKDDYWRGWTRSRMNNPPSKLKREDERLVRGEHVEIDDGADHDAGLCERVERESDGEEFEEKTKARTRSKNSARTIFNETFEAAAQIGRTRSS